MEMIGRSNANTQAIRVPSARTSIANHINALYFDNRLSVRVLTDLDRLEGQRDDVLAFAERLARFFAAARIDARDVPVTFGRGMSDIVPHILPGAWNGIVPSITYRNRHVRIDRYLAENRWARLRPGATLLDLGCGFPPVTSVDTADRFPDAFIVAIDRAHWPYLLTDRNGDRALFDETRTLRYFQPKQPSPGAWRRLVEDKDTTAARFASLLDAMLGRLPGAPDGVPAVEHDGVRLVLNPVREYARPNLTFAKGDLLSPELPAADLARCFNVLCYFSDDVRRQVLANLAGALSEDGILVSGVDWAETLIARYLVYRKEAGTLQPKEFAFTLDYLRASTNYFTLHDDDEELRQLTAAVAALRSDPAFFRDFSDRLDALHDRHDLCRRGADGYLGDIPEISADELLRRSLAVMTAIEEEGYPDRAVEALRRAGFEAWRNEAGHVAFTPIAEERK
jgi:SAM-dependent methyltransferase